MGISAQIEIVEPPFCHDRLVDGVLEAGRWFVTIVGVPVVDVFADAESATHSERVVLPHAAMG